VVSGTLLVNGLTKDNLLGGRKHVKRECDFVLIAFALKPADEGGEVEHYYRVVYWELGKETRCINEIGVRGDG